MNKQYSIIIFFFAACALNKVHAMQKRKRKRGPQYSSSQDLEKMERRKNMKFTTTTILLNMSSNARKLKRKLKKDAAVPIERLSNSSQDDRKKLAYTLLKEPNKLHTVLSSGNVKLNKRINIEEQQSNYYFKPSTVQFGQELLRRIVSVLKKCDKQYLKEQEEKTLKDLKKLSMNEKTVSSLDLSSMKEELNEIESNKKRPEEKLFRYQKTLQLLLNHGLKIEDDLIERFKDCLDDTTLKIIGVKENKSEKEKMSSESNYESDDDSLEKLLFGE